MYSIFYHSLPSNPIKPYLENKINNDNKKNKIISALTVIRNIGKKGFFSIVEHPKITKVSEYLDTQYGGSVLILTIPC